MLAKCFNVDAKVFVYNLRSFCKTTLWRGNFEYLICKDLVMVASGPMNSVTFWLCIPLILSMIFCLWSSYLDRKSNYMITYIM